MKLKRMGVMNVTPNSFSDGGEFNTPHSLSQRIMFLKNFDAIDIGCESTAPMNAALPWETEWERWQLVLPYLKGLACTVSADTYHPETIIELVKYWKDEKISAPLIWNDVSGKYDSHVRDFLKTGHGYVFCHNLAPTRALTGRHMEYVAPEIDLYDYFRPYRHSQVIFDPCLGFSKSYEQNWEILRTFGELQKKLQHEHWLIGFSRKSFLRKKYSVVNRDDLDRIHALEVGELLKTATGEFWIRTHRPELLT